MATYRAIFLCSAVLFGTSLGHSQHDAQRNAMQSLAKGDSSGFSEAFLNPRVDAGLAETKFVGMLSLLAEGKDEQALQLAEKALAHGLPASRLFAGPQKWTKKLRSLPGFAALPGVEEVGSIVHGPMLGDVTDTGAKVWVRAREEGALRVVYSVEGSAMNFTSPVEFTEENDLVGVFHLNNLQPDSEIRFTIATLPLILGSDAPSVNPSLAGVLEEPMRFRTRPREGTATKCKVAFGGGAGFVPEWEFMWDTIRSFEPDAMLMLGDNVYIDQPEHLVTHHYCYSRRQSRPEWKRFVRQVPMYSIYDDHDFADNDCVPGPEIETPSWKRSVWNTFRQNWANPGYGGGESQPGCWYDFSIGDIQFFMLDGRYYRDLQGGSMLGSVQKEWLLEELAKSKATFKVVVSPVPFTPGIKPGSRDPWDGFPEEREEIFSVIDKTEGVFLVCADRHRTDLRKTERAHGYTLYEFESSRLTNRHVHSVVKTEGLVWGYNSKCSFGLMEFDTTASDPQVTFRCIDIEGVEHENFVLQRSRLQK